MSCDILPGVKTVIWHSFPGKIVSWGIKYSVTPLNIWTCTPTCAILYTHLGHIHTGKKVCKDDAFDVGEHRYIKGEIGNPLMCNVVCETLGQGHIHFVSCTATQADDCTNDKPSQGQCHHRGHFVQGSFDECTHSEFWKRLQFVDPCGDRGLQFSKCGAKCPARSHKGDQNVFCDLKKWHESYRGKKFSNGFVCHGHHFTCGPHQELEPIHHVFIVDQSSSMEKNDAGLVCGDPGLRLKYGERSRLDAVLDACFQYLVARSTKGIDDIISFISFNSQASTLFQQRELRDLDLLQEEMKTIKASGDTNFSKVWKLLNETCLYCIN